MAEKGREMKMAERIEETRENRIKDGRENRG